MPLAEEGGMDIGTLKIDRYYEPLVMVRVETPIFCRVVFQVIMANLADG